MSHQGLEVGPIHTHVPVMFCSGVVSNRSFFLSFSKRRAVERSRLICLWHSASGLQHLNQLRSIDLVGFTISWKFRWNVNQKMAATLKGDKFLNSSSSTTTMKTIHGTSFAPPVKTKGFHVEVRPPFAVFGGSYGEGKTYAPTTSSQRESTYEYGREELDGFTVSRRSIFDENPTIVYDLSFPTNLPTHVINDQVSRKVCRTWGLCKTVQPEV